MKTKSLKQAIKRVRKDIKTLGINMIAFQYQPVHSAKEFKFPTVKRIAKQVAKFVDTEIKQNKKSQEL